MKAIALYSGGLDSMLAIRLMLDQGIEVEALHFVSVFDSGIDEQANRRAALESAERLGVPLRVEDFSGDLLRLVKDPPHGRGRNMNPCIDCHARMVRRAAELMPETGASFIITGEVLGERPMSQRADSLQVVERDAGIAGLLLRPLCARLLDPTVPEAKGWVDRKKLLGISGRCRKPQLELAKKYGITKFPTPAGGCLLTDPGFAARMRDLLKSSPDCDPEDVRLLKVGRHLRLSPATRLVIGRNEEENGWIERFARDGDLLLDAAGVPGPTALLRGETGEETVALAASLTAQYGKGSALPVVRVRLRRPGPEEERFIEVAPASRASADRLRIGIEEHGPGGRRGRE